MGRFSRSSPDAFIFDRTVICMTSSTTSQQFFFQRRVYLYVKTEWHHTLPPLSLRWEGPLGCLLVAVPSFTLFDAVAGHIDQQPATKWSQVSYIHGTTLLYNQARWLLCQGQLGVRSCAYLLPRLNFGAPLLPISQASLGGGRRSRHFLMALAQEFYQDQSRLALTSRCTRRIPSTRLPSCCGL